MFQTKAAPGTTSIDQRIKEQMIRTALNLVQSADSKLGDIKGAFGTLRAERRLRRPGRYAERDDDCGDEKYSSGMHERA